MEKTLSVVPDCSVIGMLLASGAKRLVVRSDENGIVQHDGFSWQIENGAFVPAELSRRSRFVEQTISDWVFEAGEEAMAGLVEAVFTLIEATGEESFHAMSESKLRSAESMVKALRRLPQEQQSGALSTLAALLKTGGSVLKEELMGKK